LNSPTIAQGEVGRFEGTYEIKNQVLDDFISILKEDMIHIGLTASNHLFGEFTFASILSAHKQWYECVFALASEHQQGFNQVCQRILGDLFGMFEDVLFSPKTTTRTKFFLHVLHYLQQGGNGLQFTVRIDELPLAVLQTRGGVLDLVQVLTQMLMRWVTASMTMLSRRLNGLASLIPTDFHEGDLDTENEKREIHWFLGWAIWHLHHKLSKQRRRAKVNNWVLAENAEPLIQHLDGMRCFHHAAIINQEDMKN
jgi:hypothetical protein